MTKQASADLCFLPSHGANHVQQTCAHVANKKRRGARPCPLSPGPSPLVPGSFPTPSCWRGAGPLGAAELRGGPWRFPAPGRCPGWRPFGGGCPAPRAQRELRRRHVFRGQRERPAAPGGAAQARGGRGKDQGLPGCSRASAVLHAECLQGCPASWCSSWK